MTTLAISSLSHLYCAQQKNESIFFPFFASRDFKRMDSLCSCNAILGRYPWYDHITTMSSYWEIPWIINLQLWQLSQDLVSIKGWKLCIFKKKKRLKINLLMSFMMTIELQLWYMADKQKLKILVHHRGGLYYTFFLTHTLISCEKCLS